MFIDKYLSWDWHVRQLCKKLSRANGILSKLRHNAPRDVCLQVYYALFYSHLIYGCNLWGFTSEENIKKIEVLQRKCLRIITFSDFQCHSNPLFIQLGLIKVRDIIRSQQLKLAFDYFSGTLPIDINVLFTSNSTIHEHDNRHSQYLLHLPEIQTTTYGNKSIKFCCPMVWNNTVRQGIPITANKSVPIEAIHNNFQFKRTLKKHFLYSYSLED